MATNAWDETAPAGTQLASTIDDHMRQMKLDLRERLETFMKIGVSTSEDGYIKTLPFRAADNTSLLSTNVANSLTGSNAQNAIDLAQTWNTTGAPTAIKANITKTAAGATALLQDLQVGAVSKFKVDTNGLLLGLLGLKSATNDQLDMNDGTTLITTSAATQEVNDWALGVAATVYLCTFVANGVVELSGIAGGVHGRVIILWKYDATGAAAGATLRLMHADSSSSAGNRFFLASGTGYYALHPLAGDYPGVSGNAIAFVYVDSAVVSGAVSGWYELWHNGV